MTEPSRKRGFLNGLWLGVSSGVLGGLAALYLLTTQGVVSVSVLEMPEARLAIEWCQRNLGLSVVPFGITLGLYVHSLRMLRRRLDEGRPQDEISQLEHLNDVWTSLFFGIGVIWTAIGMRSALIFALGDRDAALQQGAFAMLERMIDGGILLALSTTIFGGVGGYVMRVYKTILLGTQLQQQYDNAARADTSEMRASLQRIEQHLRNDDGVRESAGLPT
ncbi:MAG: hypothetical protein WBN90_02675 [Gammaproteobacteria bacterium]